jgi:YfiH family protein
MIVVKKTLLDDFPIYTYLYLRNNHRIIFCFTTRYGGCSRGRFKSLNVDYSVGDNRANVRNNRDIILDKIGFYKSEKIYSIKQVHGSRIIKIDKDKNYDSDEVLEEADCMITDRRDFPVMVMGADCNLILIADVKRKVVAAVHAGWKGTLYCLVSKVVLFMKDIFESRTDDLFVSFGPSIRKCCYRVRDSLVKEFIKKFGNKDFYLEKDRCTFLDLVKVNYMQLQELGIKKENIFDCKTCTCCNPGFFSYRRSKITGRQAGIAIIESGY